MPTYGLYLSTLVHEFIGIYVRKLSNKLNKNMTIHKIKRVSTYFLSDELNKLQIRHNSIYHI